MVLAFDITLMKPGCVIIQAAMGGSVPTAQFMELFRSEDWLLAPTDNMRTYRVSEKQLAKISRMTRMTSDAERRIGAGAAL